MSEIYLSKEPETLLHVSLRTLLPPEISEATNHFSILHSCAAGAGLDGKLILASFGENVASGEKLPSIIKHFRIGDVDGMTQAAVELAKQEGRNIYTPLAVMRPDLPHNAKGTENDIVAVLGFVADFDKGTGVNYPERCPLKPSYVLETSPGNAQCFFLLEKPILTTSDTDRAKAKELATRLTQTCTGADSCGADISHVWRIPGLFNYPNAKKLKEGRDPNPFTVRTLQLRDGNLTMQNFEGLPAAVKPPVEASAPSLALEYKKPVNLQQLAAQGDTPLVSLIENGAEKGKRSEAVGHVVWALLQREYGTGDIADIIAAHPKGIGERYNRDRKRIDDDVLRLAHKKPETAAAEVAAHDKPKQPYSLQELGPIDESTLQPRPWIFGRHLLRGHVTVLIAPPGVGKSTVSLTWGISIAANKNLCDLQVWEPGAVGFINNEDDPNEMRRRLAALMKFHKVSQAELNGRVYFQSGAERHFTIAKRDKGTKTMYAYHKADVIDFCREHKIKVLFVDPFLETHEADENNNREISEVARMYREVAQEADCAIVLVHHTRKQQGTSSSGHAGNMDSGRGASSLIGVARIVCTLYDMSEQDAKHYGICDEERHLYLRLDDAKANLSLKSNQALWYRRETVSLTNGDNVGVLRVAYNIQTAIAPRSTEQSGVLLAAIKAHPAFEKLRENEKMKREAFISAMLEAKVFLGRKTDSRSTLQGRIDKVLLGKGIADATTNLYMDKLDGRYTVYADFDDADLPDNAGNHPANKSQQGFSGNMPVPAEISRQNPHKGAENLVAGLPPL